MLKLHYHPRSTFSRRVRIALLEKQIPVEFLEVDIRGGAHKSPAFLALNPYGRVPVLEDDGLVLYESTAILEYLEARHPTPHLLPGDPGERAPCSMHMKLCDLDIGAQTSTLIFPLRFVPKERWDEAEMAQAKQCIERHLAILEPQLVGKEYLVGGRYSLVEVCYTPFAEFFPFMGITAPPAVAAWTERMLDRPSARATKPDR